MDLSENAFGPASAIPPTTSLAAGTGDIALIVAAGAACVIAASVIWTVAQRRQIEAQLAGAGNREALADRRWLLLGLALGYVVVAAALLWSLDTVLAGGLVLIAASSAAFALRHARQQTLYAQFARAGMLQEKLDDALADSVRKGRLLKTLAHDMRNPLGAVTLHAEIAKIKLAKAQLSEVAEALDLIHQCTTETKQILSDFLEISRMQWDEESVNIAEVDASKLLHEIVGTVAPQASGKGLRLEAEVQPGVTLVTDRSKLYRVILNLLGNALKYTSRGEVTVRLECDDNLVTFAVADTGPGIAEEMLPLLFEEFYQVADGDHDPRDGFGLGLTITRCLVQQLGGAVTVDSKVGQGSTFTVCIPRSFAANRRFPTPKSKAPAA